MSVIELTESCILICSEDGVVPVRATKSSAGLDVLASQDGSLAPGEWKAVPTGLRIRHVPEELRNDVGLLLLPRSGLAAKYGVTILNGPGLIDLDYEGEIKVILINLGKETFGWFANDRIAQLVVTAAFPRFVAHLEGGSERGQGGFGSSGN